MQLFGYDLFYRLYRLSLAFPLLNQQAYIMYVLEDFRTTIVNMFSANSLYFIFQVYSIHIDWYVTKTTIQNMNSLPFCS